MSDDRAAKPKFAALSPTRFLLNIRNNKFITQGEKLETVIAKVDVSNISSPPLKRR